MNETKKCNRKIYSYDSVLTNADKMKYIMI